MRKGLRYTLLIILLLLFHVGGRDSLAALDPLRSAHRPGSRCRSFLPLQIEATEVTGRLADRLRLQGVRVRWQNGEAEAATLLLDWHPATLLEGRLAIDKIALTGVAAHIHPTEKQQPTSPSLALPEIGGVGRYLQADIKSLQVDGFTLYPDAGEPVTVSRFAARLAWRNGVFTVDELQVAAPRGRLAGDMSLDLGGPALRADLQAEPAPAPADIRTVALQLDLRPGPAAREMRGPLRLSARSGDQERLRLTGQVDWSRDRLALSSLRLSEPGRQGRGQW